METQKRLHRASILDMQRAAAQSIAEHREYAPPDVVQEAPAPARPSNKCCCIPCPAFICAGYRKLGLTTLTMIGVVVGFCLGLLVQAVANVDPCDKGDVVLALIAYPGDLFISGLKLIVVPMIATGMILSVIKLGDLGKIKFLGTRALGYYLTTTFIGAAEGLLMVNIFSPGKGGSGGELDSCGGGGALPTTSKGTIDAFLDVGRSMAPPNLAEAFLTTNILGIITFCLCFGYYVNTEPDQKKKDVVLTFFDVSNNALMGIVNMLIGFTPYGVASLVMSEVAKQQHLWELLGQLALFVGATLCGLACHALFVYPMAYFLTTRKSPIPVYKAIVQAQLTAFATSSSAATLPVTIKCVEGLGVEEDIARFVLPLGATINMDGTAIYFPIAVIFLANFQNYELSIGNQVAVAFVSSFVSIGAAPIPNAGLVYLILIMGSVGVPTGSISFVLAIDWFLDRCQTMCNVTGDSFGANILSHLRRKHMITKGSNQSAKGATRLEEEA